MLLAKEINWLRVVTLWPKEVLSVFENNDFVTELAVRDHIPIHYADRQKMFLAFHRKIQKVKQVKEYSVASSVKLSTAMVDKRPGAVSLVPLLKH